MFFLCLAYFSKISETKKSETFTVTYTNAHLIEYCLHLISIVILAGKM